MNTATKPPAQVAESHGNAAVLEAADILGHARTTLTEIEARVEDLNGLMVGLLMLDLPEYLKASANNLGAEANELFDTLDEHFEKLRLEVITSDERVDEETLAALDRATQPQLSVTAVE